MSAAMFSLAVSQDGQPDTQIDVKMRHIVVWEKAFSGRAVSMLDDSRVKMTYLYELAWIALGQVGEFKAFCETTDIATVDDDEDSANPIQAVA